jgi:hypothetical protein
MAVPVRALVPAAKNERSIGGWGTRRRSLRGASGYNDTHGALTGGGVDCLKGDNGRS